MDFIGPVGQGGQVGLVGPVGRRGLAALIGIVLLALLAPRVRADVDRYEVYAVRFATLASFPVSSLVAGAKMLLGLDPKRNYKRRVAEVFLRQGSSPSRVHH